MGKTIDSDDWLEMVLGDDRFRRTRAFNAILQTVTRNDVLDLIGVCEKGSIEEKVAAFRVLMQLARSKDERFSSSEKRRWQEIIKMTVREEFPQAPLGSLGLQALIENDMEDAESFLVGEVDLNSMTDLQRTSMVMSLSIIGSAGALSKLVEMEEMGGQAGRSARYALEKAGAMRLDEIEELSREWKGQRSGEALARLYRGHIIRLYGAPMSDILDLLGEPTRRYETSYYYENENEDTCLSLEEDREGRFIGGYLK
jgi:hypothetical protein